MANNIEPANLSSDRFVSALSRYRKSSVIYYSINDRKYTTFTTYKKQIKTTAGPRDRYMVIPPQMEYRPDRLSKEVYGSVDLWWKILEANNIKDIFDFKAGLNIRIPNNIY
jgi:hypothetical protein